MFKEYEKIKYRDPICSSVYNKYQFFTLGGIMLCGC